MAALPKFYLPVILPPRKDPSDPPAYYAGIKNLTEVMADSGGNDGSLEITITNASTLHPAAQFDNPVTFSSVFAPTSGFARFYPGSASLPTPDQGPMDPPPNLITTDIGSIVIHIWISSYIDFIKTPLSDVPRANRIVLGWLQRSTVEALFKPEIHKLNIQVLAKSWKETGGSGAPPGQTALE